MPEGHQVPEGSGEQAKMEETVCEIIGGAPTLAVKGQRGERELFLSCESKSVGGRTIHLEHFPKNRKIQNGHRGHEEKLCCGVYFMNNSMCSL